MKLRLLSDLHLEHADFTPPPAGVGVDVTVLAGDIDTGVKGIRWAKANFPEPVIYVAGNHEFYSHDFPRLYDKLRAEAAGSNVTVLENDSIVIAGVSFLGCTLWTDFALYGAPSLAAFAASRGMNDYRAVRWSQTFGRLKPDHTMAWHHTSKAWLKERLKATTGPVVVVAHHLPSAQSLHPGFPNDPLNPAYASNLDDMFHEPWAPALWCHGHSHWKVDYESGSTRIVSNPRGYPGDFVKGFDPGLVLEVCSQEMLDASLDEA